MFAKVTTLLKTSAIYGLGNALGKFFGVVLLPVFTTYLLPDEYAVFDSLNLFLFFSATLAVLGVDAAVARFYYDSENQARRSSVISAGLLYAFAAGIGLMAVLILVHPLIRRYVFSGHAGEDILVITLVSIAFVGVFNVLLSVLQTKRQPIRYSIVSHGRTLLLYGLSVLFLIRGEGVRGVMTALLISTLISVLLGLWFIRRDLSLKLDVQLLRPMLAFGIPVSLASLGIWFIVSSDRFFLLHYVPLSEAGTYSVGARIASLVSMSLLAFQMAWPQFLFSLMRDSELAYTFSRIFTYFVVVGCFLVLVVALFASDLLQLLSTAAYHGADKVILLLSVAALLTGMQSTLGVIPSLVKKTLSLVPIVTMTVGVHIVLNLVLVPAFASYGAASAVLVSNTLLVTLMYIVSRRMLRVTFEWRRLGLLVGITTIIILLADTVRLQQTWLRLATNVALLLSTIPILFLFGFFERNELLTFRRLLGWRSGWEPDSEERN